MALGAANHEIKLTFESSARLQPCVTTPLIFKSTVETDALECLAGNGYGGETATVTVNDLSFNGGSASTNINLQLTSGIIKRVVDDIVLVGDSVAMVVLGYDDTLQVTVADMAHHVGAVARARPRAGH